MAMRRMLRCAAGRSRMDRGLRRPLAAYFSSPVRIDEKVYVYFLRQRSRITTEMRAALLVVVVLLITISFQTVLKPPEGILLDNTYQSIAPTNFSIEIEVKPLPHFTRTLFMLENSLTVLMFFLLVHSFLLQSLQYYTSFLVDRFCSPGPFVPYHCVLSSHSTSHFRDLHQFHGGRIIFFSFLVLIMYILQSPSD